MAASRGVGHGRIARELLALALIALAIFGSLSLLCLDLGLSPNLGGLLGARLAFALSGAFGYGSYAVMVLVTGMAVGIWRGASVSVLGFKLLGGALLVAMLSGAAGLWSGGSIPVSGALGRELAEDLRRYLNLGGGYMAVLLGLMCALTIVFGRAPTDLAGALSCALGLGRKPSSEPSEKQQWRSGWEQDPGDADEGARVAQLAAGKAGAPAPLRVSRVELREAAGRETGVSARKRGGFKLPTHSLLDSPPARHSEVDEAALQRSARTLEQKLADFGVQGRVCEVQPGPVVTMYKFEPASGVKVSQIVNLADDLSLALRAATVRIQAPVPGEAVVGIEVPNRRREMVYLREILEAPEFGAAQSQLTIALGKDIAGQPVAADLVRMPHLLIAGATGTGKSVSIHTMIASILFNATADDVRFILIDPKMLELSVYEGIPHLLVPVVIDLEKAAAALLWATQEMECRYRLMRDMAVRNLDGYNQAVAAGGRVIELRVPGPPAEDDGASAKFAAAPLEHRRLPKIVIVIDELADLLLAEGKSVERDITRLAQKARAAGIHLILATQRPSVDVLTGLIKANLPARLSFQVTSRVDSRTILDSIGAERLLGAGDMLFMPPGSARLRRLHGPFVSEAEIRRLVDFLRAQGAPEYRMEILETRAPGEGDGDSNPAEQDEMYDEAVRIVMETNQASVSMIQRRLRIGYNRAARMIEQMEREGLVTAGDGSRPREVRITRMARE